MSDLHGCSSRGEECHLFLSRYAAGCYLAAVCDNLTVDNTIALTAAPVTRAPHHTECRFMLLLDHLHYKTDDGLAGRARIGLIVLATDYTIEHEWQRVFYPLSGVALYHSRIFNQDRVTPQSLRAMGARLTDCARAITPATPPDVIAYGCTSAAMAIGEERVFEHIRRARPGVKCTTPITAAFAAFDAFKARRIGILTPYSAAVNRIVEQYITARGFDVAVLGTFNQEQDSTVARIAPASIEAALREMVRRAEVDMLFVSCTSVRLVAACARLEAELGVPLTSSNHAMAWHALRLAGIDDRLPEWGGLYIKDLPV